MPGTVIYSIYFTLIRDDMNFPFSEKYENNIHFIYRHIIRKLEFEREGSDGNS